MMPRPKKFRKVEFIPENLEFRPVNETNSVNFISIVELEAIRLSDLEELDQSQAAERMKVSRGTYQRILTSGRKKLTDALVKGKKIKISGGNYVFNCGSSTCTQKCDKYQGGRCLRWHVKKIKNNEEDLIMKIAVPAKERSLNSKVEDVFGRTQFFVVVDVETKEFDVVENDGASASGGAGITAAQCVADSGADAVVTYQCGKNAADVLDAANIKIFKAEDLTVEEIIDKYNKGELKELEEVHSGFHKHGGR
jgi:predicted Fe-Mo cluster-binding NifX family protein/predicted DNA-binding protein (UPF0251 family)